MTKNTVIRISLKILPRYIVPAREKVDFHTVIRISLKILPRYIVPAREKVDFHGEEDIWYPPEIILHYTWLIVLSHNSIIQELCSVPLASKNLGLLLGQLFLSQ